MKQSNSIYDFHKVTSRFRIIYTEIDFAHGEILFLRVFFKRFEKAVSGGGKEWKIFKGSTLEKVVEGSHRV